MPQVVPYRRQLSPAPKRVSRMRVPHPVRRRPLQLLGQSRIHFGEDSSRSREEPSHDRPQPLRRDTGLSLEAADQWRRRIPARRRHRKPPLEELSIERRSSHRRQNDLARLGALANDMEPMIAVRVHLDGTERGRERARRRAAPCCS